MLQADWQVGTPDFELNEDRVDIWRAPLDLTAPEESILGGLLSSDEWARANRFHFSRDRRRFIAARGALRVLLSQYLGCDAHAVHFTYGAMGKPAVTQSVSLRFNASHSNEMAVYAVSWRREVGVDVEFNRPLTDLEQLAASCFSAAENAALREVPAAQRREAFFNAWTRKEAYIKATGDGLSFALDQFDVSLKPGEPERLLRVAGRPGDVSDWQLQAFQPADQYTAALAIEGQGGQFRFWQWDTRLL